MKHLSTFRWSLLLIFIIGYFTTFTIFDSFEFEYLGITIASIISCYLLLSCLKAPLIDKLPVWLLLIIFILYYIQFYWIVFHPEITSNFWFLPLRWLAYSPDVLLKTYATTTYAFVTFCFTAWLLIKYTRISQKRIHKRKINYISVVSMLRWFIPTMMGITFYLMYITGIARMASPSVYLPFRLAGIIFYIRLMIIPGLLLLLIWCSNQADLRKHLIFGVLLLFFHGVGDMLLRSSRGSILTYFLMLSFLFLITKQMSKKRLILFIFIILLNILLWPIITSYRYIRIGDYPLSISRSLSEAIKSPSYKSLTFTERSNEAMQLLLFRAGMVSLLPIVGTSSQPIGTQVFNVRATRFFTIEILGYSPYAIHSSAPSLIGWFYMVGDNLFVVIGIFAFTLLTWVFWHILPKAKLLCLPIAQVLFLITIFKLSMEGTLDKLHLNIFILVGSITVSELITRIFSGNKIILNKQNAIKK